MSLTIGALAKRAGVGVQTLRYYERRGLLSKARRTPAGYRQFPEEEVRRVRFIRRAQGWGFTLEEVRSLLALRVAPGRSCATVKLAARQAQVRVRERLAELQRLNATLAWMIRACEARRVTEDCPVLRALETDGGG